MTGEFRIKVGWRILFCVTVPVFIGAILYVGYVNLRSNPLDPGLVFLAAFLFAGALLLLYALIDVMRARLVIGPDSLSRRYALGTRTLHFSEIKGYRRNQNYVFLETIDPHNKTIRISRYMESDHQIMGWVNSSFQDLETKEAEEEHEEILSDNTLGINRQAREFRLNEAKKITRYANWASVVVCIWLTFFPRPRALVSLVAMTLPIAALLVIYKYRGLIRINGRDNSSYPSIFTASTLPTWALLIRALLDWDILEYQSTWIAMSAATLVLSGLFLVGTKEFSYSKFSDLFAALVLTASMFGYVYGAYVISNCLFDQSAPRQYKVDVVDKKIGSGRTTTYHVVVGPWGQEAEPRKLTVTGSQFNMLKKGDTVVLHLKKGLFGTPWLYAVTESATRGESE